MGLGCFRKTTSFEIVFYTKQIVYFAFLPWSCTFVPRFSNAYLPPHQTSVHNICQMRLTSRAPPIGQQPCICTNQHLRGQPLVLQLTLMLPMADHREHCPPMLASPSSHTTCGLDVIGHLPSSPRRGNGCALPMHTICSGTPPNQVANA